MLYEFPCYSYISFALSVSISPSQTPPLLSMHRLSQVTRQVLIPHWRHQTQLIKTTTAMSSSTASISSSSPSVSSPLSSKLKVACIQMTSGSDSDANIAQFSKQIRLAAQAGAKLICTPENTGRMTAHTQKQTKPADEAPPVSTDSPSSSASSSSGPPSESSHPALLALISLAHELNVWLLVGSLAVHSGSMDPNEKRFANRSYLIAPTDQINVNAKSTHASASSSSTSSSLPPSVVATYDKIFMFDVPSLNGSESYMESSRVVPGDTSMLVDLSDSLADGAVIGMSICYDLRFPHLYRQLAQCGASILVVPSAFTVVTGEAHWHTLLRARAIENGCFVLAPAQCGSHPGGRHTYGHSLIVDPWGKIVADGGVESPAVILADIDLEQCAQARHRIPSLQHDRPFTLQQKQVTLAQTQTDKKP